MSRSSMDFDIRYCEDKPCGKPPLGIEPDPQKRCLGDQCRFYKVCDLKMRLPGPEPLSGLRLAA
jgi:hypothetical protein